MELRYCGASQLQVHCSHLPALLWLHVAIRRQQRAEAQQRQVHSRAALLHQGPALPEAPGGRGWWGQVRVSRAGVAVVMMTTAVVIVGVRRRDAAFAVAANQERPPVVTVVEHAGRHQQHQHEGAEQEEKHVDAFSLGRKA